MEPIQKSGGAPYHQRGYSRPARQAGRHQQKRVAHIQPMRSSPAAAPGGIRLRVFPLGGVGEFGRNMTVVEYGKDIVIIDIGLMFPIDTMPGVDFVLPDISYIKQRRQNIRGIYITHGHLDHMGAIPYLIRDIGNPPIYGTKLTMGMIRDRLEEFHLEQYARLSEVHPDDVVQLGAFRLTFFRVNHNIPDSTGVVVRTPIGNLVFTGDWKFDHTPQDEKPTEFGKLAKIGAEGVLLLCGDSTNAERAGYAMSERDLEQNIETLFRKSKGRIIVATFASLISRIQQIINVAASLNRKIAISGTSMEKALMIAAKLGYLKIPKGTLIRPDQIDDYADEHLVIICTGSQGQETSALGRMSRGEHRHVKLRPGDTVVLSSSPIPGNERAIMNLMNKLFSFGADVIYKQIYDIHTSGHAHQEELKMMFNILRPKYFMPMHGERYMLVRHAELAKQLGWDDKSIFVINNGEIIEFNQQGQAMLSKEKINVDYVMVDGLGVGDVSEVVLRDRQVLAQDGMVVIIATVDANGKTTQDPDVISRGFVFMKSTEKLMIETRSLVVKIINGQNLKDIEQWGSVRDKIRDDVGKLLFQKTEKRPMVLPVIVQV